MSEVKRMGGSRSALFQKRRRSTIKSLQSRLAAKEKEAEELREAGLEMLANLENGRNLTGAYVANSWAAENFKTALKRRGRPE